MSSPAATATTRRRRPRPPPRRGGREGVPEGGFGGAATSSARRGPPAGARRGAARSTPADHPRGAHRGCRRSGARRSRTTRARRSPRRWPRSASAPRRRARAGPARPGHQRRADAALDQQRRLRAPCNADLEAHEAARDRQAVRAGPFTLCDLDRPLGRRVKHQCGPQAPGRLEPRSAPMVGPPPAALVNHGEALRVPDVGLEEAQRDMTACGSCALNGTRACAARAARVGIVRVLLREERRRVAPRPSSSGAARLYFCRVPRPRLRARAGAPSRSRRR